MKYTLAACLGLLCLVTAGAVAAQGMGAMPAEGDAAGMAAGMAAAGGMAGGAASSEPVNRCAPEFQGQIPNSVAAVDTSGNGTIEKDELAAHVAGGQLDNLFGRWDTDSDGALSEQEFCFRQ